MKPESETPRVDAFVAQRPPTVLVLDDFVNSASFVRTDEQVRELMIAWASFARELERELNNSTPNEWKGQ